MTKEEYDRITKAANDLVDALSAPKRSEREKSGGPYAALGQATWRATDLRDYIKRNIFHAA